jgi:uroporphyrin-III C-methyltransferase
LRFLALVVVVVAAAAAASDDDDSHYYSGDARGPNAVEDVVELYLARARATAADSDPSSIVDPDDDSPPRRGRGKGRVYLIGTGPGDPGLLTLKAFHLMQTADVVLYDRLVAPAILDMVHADARMLYVGKQAGFHTRTQDEIEAMLLGFAEVGATVVRLKGGDPLVFGRGGEEMEALMARGHAVSIVPGVTAAAGVGSELGIPLTHRGAATSVRLLTGHLREGAAKEAASGEGNAVADPIDFAVTAADLDTTLVVYMGLGTLPSLAGKVRSHHAGPHTTAFAW